MCLMWSLSHRHGEDLLTRTGHHVSGNGGVYTCPKTEDKQISSECMIVWTKSNAVELALNLSQCENHFGLVRLGVSKVTLLHKAFVLPTRTFLQLSLS